MNKVYVVGVRSQPIEAGDKTPRDIPIAFKTHKKAMDFFNTGWLQSREIISPLRETQKLSGGGAEYHVVVKDNVQGVRTLYLYISDLELR